MGISVFHFCYFRSNRENSYSCCVSDIQTGIPFLLSLYRVFFESLNEKLLQAKAEPQTARIAPRAAD